jgi:hypothetical protein
MSDVITQNSIYQEALDNALSEVHDLGEEVSQLRDLLDLLEHRKKAVEEMCVAIQRLVDSGAHEVSQDASILAFPKGLVALTQEEVSLITNTTSGLS